MSVEIIIQIALGVLTLLGLILGFAVSWGKLKQLTTDLRDRVGRLETQVNGHSLSIAELKTSVFAKQNSPRLPNEQGRQALEESGFNRIFPQVKDQLFQTIENKYKPRTLYDVERSAFFALKDMKDNPLFDPIKNYSVNHSDNDLDSLFLLGSWIIRDLYATSKNVTK